MPTNRIFIDTTPRRRACARIRRRGTGDGRFAEWPKRSIAGADIAVDANGDIHANDSFQSRIQKSIARGRISGIRPGGSRAVGLIAIEPTTDISTSAATLDRHRLRVLNPGRAPGASPKPTLTEPATRAPCRRGRREPDPTPHRRDYRCRGCLRAHSARHENDCLCLAISAMLRFGLRLR